MKKMIKKISKLLGGLLILALILTSVPLTGTAHAAAVTISISGITNHTGPALGSGAYVQVLQSSDATANPPASDGSPGGNDSFIGVAPGVTGAINPDGSFAGGASVPSSQYVFIRAWETWDGTGSPPAGTYYGNSIPENVGIGFVYPYTAAGFATGSQTAGPVPTITQFEMTSAPGIAITTAAISDGISIIGTNFGATQGTSTVVFYNGVPVTSIYYWSDTKIDLQVPTGAQTGSVTVTVGGQPVSASLTITGGTGGPIIDDVDGLTATGGYPGQTMFINGSGFGADIGSSTVTVGGIATNPTAWSDTQIVTSIPNGVAAGAADVVATTTAGSNTDSITIITTGAVLDDYEGGSVGTWATGLADSGYYTFGAGVTPDDSTISTDGPQAAAVAQGARGMQIMYSYVSDWGGGWGGQMANTLDLSAYDNFSFYVAWDGSTNDITLSVKDGDGTAYAASVSNATLSSLTGYAQVTLFLSAFSHDVDGSDATADATMDWSAVNSYNILYRTTGTSTTYHSLDSLVAGDVDLGGGGDPVDPTEILITDIDPDAGPAGSKFIANGIGFGATQGQSILVFENTTTGINYDVSVLAWSDTLIEAIVPRLAPAGNYQLKVLKLAISQGTMTAQESNAETFQVTAGSSTPGTATVFPNPFNPLETSVPATRASGLPASAATIAYNATGATTIGIYIYSSTARLVFHDVTTDATQVTWNGRDMKGNFVADGVYLLRVVNEESKTTIAKAKILVIKR